MAKTYVDQVYSGTLGTSETTITTVGVNTTFIIKGFVISNSNSADKKASLKIDDKRILPYVKAIPTGDSLIRSDLNIPVTTGKTIKLYGEVASDMDYYIWGVNEVTS
ncbi:MAG: hypothetical protein AB6733_12070 [Clostridiaceae bacterium]